MLYERTKDMAGRVAKTMKQASREATMLLYAPVLDRHLEAMAELADRVFCFIFGLAFVLGYLNGYLGFWH
jgi:hypothetical protein